MNHTWKLVRELEQADIEAFLSEHARETEEMMLERDALRAMLKRLEWSGSVEPWLNGDLVGTETCCPCCGYTKKEKHDPLCELAKLLEVEDG